MPLPTETRLELGSRLRALRVGRGMSADAVACAALGFHSPHHAAVTRLERGALKFISPEHVLKLAAYYGVPVSELLPVGVTLQDLAVRPTPSTTPADEPTRAKTSLESGPGSGSPPLTLRGTEVPSTIPSPQARLRQLRAQLGLGAREFAQRLSSRQVRVSERDVLEWESAARRPNADQYEALERVTGASERWIKTGRLPGVR